MHVARLKIHGFGIGSFQAGFVKKGRGD